MSKKGENKKAKTISIPNVINISRKNSFWTVKTKAGPHNKQTSVPLGLIVRDYIGAVAKMKDAKKVLNSCEVKVNGVVRVDHQFPVGLFDVIAIDKQKLYYRVMLDSKGRLVLNSLDKESKEKVSKVKNKIMTSKGIQVTMNDGRTFTGIKANVGDSVKISLPEGKAQETIEFKEGALALVTKGAHCSQIATIKGIVEGTARRAKLVKLSAGEKEFETVFDNVIVIGKNKSEMTDVQ